MRTHITTAIGAATLLARYLGEAVDALEYAITTALGRRDSALVTLRIGDDVLVTIPSLLLLEGRLLGAREIVNIINSKGARALCLTKGPNTMTTDKTDKMRETKMGFRELSHRIAAMKKIPLGEAQSIALKIINARMPAATGAPPPPAAQKPAAAPPPVESMGLRELSHLVAARQGIPIGDAQSIALAMINRRARREARAAR